MGFSPAEVDAMTLFQFRSAFEGWRLANSGESEPVNAFSDDDLKQFGITDGH